MSVHIFMFVVSFIRLNTKSIKHKIALELLNLIFNIISSVLVSEQLVCLLSVWRGFINGSYTECFFFHMTKT